MSERVNVKPIAEKIAAIILRNGNDPTLKWSPDRGKVTINLLKTLGGDYEQNQSRATKAISSRNRADIGG